VALANGFGFARRQADGTVVGVYPRKSNADDAKSPVSTP
jgi:hypothetical protein